MRDRRDRILDCLLAVGVLYALTLPAVVFLFSAVIRGDRPLEEILKSHLGPLLLLWFTWVGWGWALALLAPFGIAALAFRWARARGSLPVLCGILVPVWFAVGAFLVFLDAVLRE